MAGDHAEVDVNTGASAKVDVEAGISERTDEAEAFEIDRISIGSGSAAEWGSRVHLDPAEALRLRECSREPIQHVEAVQSHGILLGVAHGTVVRASASHAHWLGRELIDVSPELAVILSRRTDQTRDDRVVLNGAAYDAVISAHPDLIVIELEPVLDEETVSVADVTAAIHRIGTIDEMPEIIDSTVHELKRLTGYDRVTAFKFFEDGHGQITTDEHEPGMPTYRGLHFPASDVPMQARALFTTKLSRMIVDSRDPGQPIHVLGTQSQSTPLDLSLSELRQPSKHHLEFMRNMGQVASLTLGVVHNNKLLGMVTCSHRTPRRLPLAVRRQLEVLIRMVSAQIAGVREVQNLRRQLASKQRRAEFVAPLYGARELPHIMDESRATIRDLIPSDGVYLRCGPAHHILGKTPPIPGIVAMLEQLGVSERATDGIADEFPEIARELPGVGGVVIVPLLEEGDCLVFFREDVVHDVHWLGDQTAANRDTALSPRRDFGLWRENVTGRSLPWGTVAEEAFAMGEEIRIALQTRQNAELAELARYDPLTGLANRRLLEEHADRYYRDRRESIAAIFLDLDDFKGVNDRYGHDVGDAVLAAVGERMDQVSRDNDIPVRLSGDEFVLLCDGVTEETAQTVAKRLVDAIVQPIATDTVNVSIGASAGIALGKDHETFESLLKAADRAMYRAKRQHKVPRSVSSW